MDAVTYPDPKVQELLEESAVFFKPNVEEEEELAGRYGVTWTPGLLWLDADGVVHHGNVGWFEPDEFRAEHLFGCAKVLAGNERWKAAREAFDRVAEEHAGSFAAPAALYWGGVASKKETGATEGLVERWNRILDEQQGSAWAMKASIVRGR